MDKDIEAARESFRRAEESEQDNRRNWLDDVKFARNDEQWDESVLRARHDARRPTHTVNKLAPVVRMVVNDARANKPAIVVRPQDNDADPETAEIFSGLIRNIESTSGADIAYDTAVEHAVSGGFGYIRASIAYAHNDTFDKDILIERVANPLSVYGDPDSFAPDGSDWAVAFVTDYLSDREFEKRFGKRADKVSFEGGSARATVEQGGVQIAEWWTRESVAKGIVMLSDGQVIERAAMDANRELFAALGIEVVAEREVQSHRVRQRIISGVDVLETTEWAGSYIPIVPVIGEEVVIEDKRHLRSLIRGARGAQERYNYWISAMTEMIALSPRVPYIGPEGAFDADPERWATANREDHPYLQYAGPVPPQRQPPPQPSGAMLQEAMGASEDIKAITGIYDASLGARSNETSGVAINARRKSGDIATFHFQDNLARSMRHMGRILVDLIPKVYTQDRVIRVLGEDGKTQNATIGVPPQQMQPQQPQGDQPRIYDLAAGKYDVTVKTGPGYASMREETRAELVEIIRAFPDAAPVLGPMYLRHCDWPGAEEAADKLESMSAPAQGDPRAQQAMGQMQAQMQQAMQRMQQLEQENAMLKQGNQIKAFEAQTDRMNAQVKAQETSIKSQVALMNAAQPQVAPSPPSNPYALGSGAPGNPSRGLG